MKEVCDGLAERFVTGERVRLTAVTQDDLPTMAVWWADADFLRLYDSLPALPQSAKQLARRVEFTPRFFDGV